ncbi:MAG TPA: YihY/virulence factor BrkB family protein [Myxococcales bacterium]|nr:YihY/virulence factor BrkB family protein [Myxococcales bacterium]
MKQPGFLRVVWRVGVQLAKGNAFGLATQLAYNFFFALFPFLICLVALASFLPIHGLLHRFLDGIRGFLPANAYDLVAKQLTSALGHRHGALLTAGLAIALWSASSGITALMSGLNEAFGVRETRPFWRVRGLAMAITVAGGTAVLVILSVLVLGGRLGHWLARAIGAPALESVLWSVLRWPVTALFVMTALASVYRVCPNVKRRFRLITPGTVAGTLLWLASAVGFSFYVNNFGNYNAMYGSIATVIVLLTWFYVSGLVLILGGQIDAVVEGHVVARR